ncbi:SIR2 family protein [Bacillus toyonensis]|uniref:SIR2 family protein n=1 Tax=Bacillus toyonensis TaxID=155322 RepID=UPI001C01B1C7|nr:SIR2 family protein [Bacillus toyonensis]QWH88398.1 SIR2 family protein [Bacillus toyonensis]QWI31573.1 SIR2 family protein [Bacillus toyonensis]
MSLDNLINIVKQEWLVSQEDVLNKLESLASTVNLQVFSKQYLQRLDLDEKKVTFLIDQLASENFISKSYFYECFEQEEVETTDYLTDFCDFCERPINGDSSHNVLELFKLEKEFKSMIEIKQKEVLKKYIQEEYIDNYLFLKEKVNKLVPFLGAGVSMPLGLPSWSGLIWDMREYLSTSDDKEEFDELIDSGDFLGALDFIIEYSPTLNHIDRIKTHISKKVKSDLKYNMDDSKHNIKDIINLASDFILTTNYDNALISYRDSAKDGYITPVPVNDIEDLQEQFDEGQKQVIHFHGMADRKGTMIVTKDDYEELYANKKTKGILNGIMAGKYLVFIGFSFKDEYFVDLYTKIKDSVGGEHFIIVPNLTKHQNKQLTQRGLRAVGIKVPKDEKKKVTQQGMVDAIKYLINSII